MGDPFRVTHIFFPSAYYRARHLPILPFIVFNRVTLYIGFELYEYTLWSRATGLFFFMH